MLTFIETTNINGYNFLLNLAQVQTIEKAIDVDNLCLVRFAQGDLESIQIRENYEDFMLKVFKLLS